MFWNLFLDDIRTPAHGHNGGQNYTIARSTKQAKAMIEKTCMPKHISFDHDLGGDDTAMDLVKWIIEQDLNCEGHFIPEDFTFQVHSANPVGAQNLQAMLNNYLNYKKGGYNAS
jgi:hypothetical protein